MSDALRWWDIWKTLAQYIPVPTWTMLTTIVLFQTHINSKDTLVHSTWLDTLISYVLLTDKTVLTQHEVVKQALAKGTTKL